MMFQSSEAEGGLSLKHLSSLLLAFPELQALGSFSRICLAGPPSVFHKVFHIFIIFSRIAGTFSVLFCSKYPLRKGTHVCSD